VNPSAPSDDPIRCQGDEQRDEIGVVSVTHLDEDVQRCHDQ